MLSPSRIKAELFSSDEDDETKTQNRDGNCTEESEKIELLEFERNIMLDTFSDDVLFILARGLGLERLMLHHFYLYSDPKLLVFVINTTHHDEVYFLSRLRNSRMNCVPKVINADVAVNERETLYMEGGVHFITSRILMVDLLQGRVPVKNVAGILVHRAHQLLSSFQETFILRLYREKKPDGFVKAFTDQPSALHSLGCLQRLVNRLYVRRVRLVPRFDVDVKRVLDLYPPKLIEVRCELPPRLRKAQSMLVDIIRTCLKELKQCSSAIDAAADDDSTHPSAALTPSALEIHIKATQFSATDKQQRLLADLDLLRNLLHQAEELDSATLYRTLVTLRSDKNHIANNSGWLFTQTASKLFAEAEAMCKVKQDDDYTLLGQPKWIALSKVLGEVRSLLNDNDQLSVKESPVLLLAKNGEVCRQVRDVIKWGIKKFSWIQRRQIIDDLPSAKGSSREPLAEPLWEPSQITLFASNLDGESRNEIVSDVQAMQKTVAREGRKRRKKIQEEQEKMKKKKPADNQPKLVRFGLIRYKKHSETIASSDEPSGSEKGEKAKNDEIDSENRQSEDIAERDRLLVIMPTGERYNLIRQLHGLSPNIVILLHSDLVTLRILEVYKAINPEHELRIYVLLCCQSNEEERYLCSLRNEQLAFEQLIREQGTLLTSREYNTAREPPPKLRIAKSGRGEASSDKQAAEENPKVVVDMREFNSELPIVLYKRGTDVVPATLEVGDYILSPNIAVERKSLDDLTQSLHSGRVFKQIEQMLRHYKNVVLLVEANVKDGFRKINGGPFQGELSRHCRETRSLLAVLVRCYPLMNIVWTADPTQSAEMFEEFKLNEPNPDVDRAVMIRADDDDGIDRRSDEPSGSQANSTNATRRLNGVLQRQIKRLPNMGSGDVKRLMTSDNATCLLDVINADFEKVSSIVGSRDLARSLHSFFTTDFTKQGTKD
ncbi:DNA repair endonuclease XPF [Toxocara canis]|uniref:DNA repair endonuclease XPF n=1 Tax=Toxocara canis TaxID=6265 RepID=A0A0B2VR16_TOXCA|nr:DNA repair endonuclease XPF [Toxocara canis]